MQTDPFIRADPVAVEVLKRYTQNGKKLEFRTRAELPLLSHDGGPEAPVDLRGYHRGEKKD